MSVCTALSSPTDRDPLFRRGQLTFPWCKHSLTLVGVSAAERTTDRGRAGGRTDGRTEHHHASPDSPPSEDEVASRISKPISIARGQTENASRTKTGYWRRWRRRLAAVPRGTACLAKLHQGCDILRVAFIPPVPVHVLRVRRRRCKACVSNIQ